MNVSCTCLCILAAAFAGGASAFVVPKTTATTKLQKLHSAVSPDDFCADEPSLLQKLNDAKPEGAPQIEAILEPSYAVAWATACAGPLIYGLYGGTILGTIGNCLHVILAALLWLQTLRVRCVFEEDGFELYNLKGDMDVKKSKSRLTKKPGNFVTKTENKWAYDKVTGYQFYPSLEYFPLICYLKETQTPELYNINGEQPHFFPALFVAQQFKQQMDQRGVPYGVEKPEEVVVVQKKVVPVPVENDENKQ